MLLGKTRYVIWYSMCTYGTSVCDICVCVCVYIYIYIWHLRMQVSMCMAVLYVIHSLVASQTWPIRLCPSLPLIDDSRMANSNCQAMFSILFWDALRSKSEKFCHLGMVPLYNAHSSDVATCRDNSPRWIMNPEFHQILVVYPHSSIFIHPQFWPLQN